MLLSHTKISIDTLEATSEWLINETLQCVWKEVIQP
jgi:hypothetical protein